MALLLACLVSGSCSSDKDKPGSPDMADGGDIVTDGAVSMETAAEGGPAVASKLSRASRGSVVDISEDDAIVVAVNRDTGTVSVFDVTYSADGVPSLTKKGEVAVGAEPHQVVLAPSGDRAFVVVRKEQKLVRIDNLRTTPVKGPELAVGSEPTGLALTPKGKALWVANWIDGTVLEVDAEAMTVTTTVDLNQALAGSGLLGQGMVARPALAHPRSVAITNNKDDVEQDESVLVTEFFAQYKEALAADGSNADSARQGLVYRISLKDKTVKTVALPPLTDLGAHDHTDGVAGCYPNQLQSVDVMGSFAYVVSICASPKGPFGSFTGPAKAACTDDTTCPGALAGSCDLTTKICKTNCTANAQCGALGGVCDANVCKENFWDAKSLQTPAVSIIDLGNNKVIASVSLNKEFSTLYDTLGLPDTSARRMPLSATDLAFLPNTLTAFIPAHGADAVYKVTFNATYETKAVDAVGSDGVPFTNLALPAFDGKSGTLPAGIVMTHKTHTSDAAAFYAFVANRGTRNISVIDTKTGNIAGLPAEPVVVPSTDMPPEGEELDRLKGEVLFSTGLGRWSLNGQAWASCATCHWDSLSDQVTWFHMRGPRQSPSLDGTFNSKNHQELHMMNWNAIVDELEDHEGGALRSVAGGVGAIVKGPELVNASRIALDKNGNAGLNGSAHVAADPAAPQALVADVSYLDDWKKIGAFEANLRTPRKPSNLDSAKVAAGKAVFMAANCQGCHGGDMWTIAKRFYTPDPNVATENVGNLNKVLKKLSWKDAVTTANFPAALLPTALADAQTMRYNGAKAADLDSMTCMLRPVGTYNVAESGVGVAELRRNMVAIAQGNEDTGKGYNIPGLLGLSVGAPFFHAGNARSLEAVLSDTFAAHHAALSPGFLAASDVDAATKRAALIQYLLSIDEDTSPIEAPAVGPNGGSFCRAE